MGTEAKKSVDDESVAPPSSAPAPRLVYTQAPVLLATLVEPTESGWRADLGTVERDISVDPTVDPELLVEAARRGSRVIVDASGAPVVVGVIATQRAVLIDAENRVDARVKSFRVDAEESVLLKTPGAFLQAKAQSVEIYGNRVITKARDLAKILAAMIKLN